MVIRKTKLRPVGLLSRILNLLSDITKLQ